MASDEGKGGPEPQGKQAADDKLDRLERIVRSMGKESLEILESVKGIKEEEAGIKARIGDLDFSAKGVSQSIWKSVQDNQERILAAETHYAGSLRELEARIRAEIQWQAYRGCLQAILPGLDDLDLVIMHERSAAGGKIAEGSVLEALTIVRHKISEGLKVLGMDEIVVEPGSTAFDPGLHQIAESDLSGLVVPEIDAPRGTVIFLRKTGYAHEGRVLRPAQVIVKV